MGGVGGVGADRFTPKIVWMIGLEDVTGVGVGTGVGAAIGDGFVETVG